MKEGQKNPEKTVELAVFNAWEFKNNMPEEFCTKGKYSYPEVQIRRPAGIYDVFFLKD